MSHLQEKFMKNKPKIIFAGISLEYYRQYNCGLEYYQKSYQLWKKKLSAIADIRADGLVFTTEEIQSLLQLVPANEIDALVISPLSYTASRPVWDAVKDYDVPICIWNTQTDLTVTREYGPDDLLKNHTVQGTQDITNVLFRRKRPFQIVTGHYADPEKLQKLMGVLEVCQAVRASRNIRTFSLGGRFEGMDDFLFDPQLVKQKLGWSFEELPLDEYVKCWQSVDDAEAAALAEADFRNCQIFPGVELSRHRKFVRSYLALHKLAEKYRFDALTFNFLSFPGLPETEMVPFYGINRMLADGFGYAGEGDALRAALMAAMSKLASPVNFTEIYTVDFENQRMMMTHMQECNPACARKDLPVKLQPMPLPQDENLTYYGMNFTVEPGIATLVTLTDDGSGNLRYIAFAGAVEDMLPLENYNRGHWIIRVDDAADLLDRYSLAGGTHHLIALTGDCREKLALMAQMQNVEFVNLGGIK